MPAFAETPSRIQTAQSIFASGLLLAVCLLAPVTLWAQNTNLQTSPDAEASTFTDLKSAAPLPEAPRPASDSPETNNAIQAASASPAAASDGGVSAFRSFRQREWHLLLDLVGPTAFIAPAFESSIDFVRPLKVDYPSDGVIAPGNHPAHGDVPEWGEGVQGYAKRYADRFGQGLVGTTSRYALGEIMREDVTYHRCDCTGVLPRTAHAFVGPIWHTLGAVAPFRHCLRLPRHSSPPRLPWPAGTRPVMTPAMPCVSVS